jgi:hypothetical protein
MVRGIDQRIGARLEEDQQFGGLAGLESRGRGGSRRDPVVLERGNRSDCGDVLRGSDLRGFSGGRRGGGRRRAIDRRPGEKDQRREAHSGEEQTPAAPTTLPNVHFFAAKV